MITLIDTCSLVALARYYQPFDNDNVLYSHIENEIREGRMIVLDKVVEEAQYTAKGIALDYLSFLKDNKMVHSTESLIPSRRFYNMLDNNFVVPSEKRLLDDPSLYEERRIEYLKSADAALVIYAESYHGLEPIQIVTEESNSTNDRKLFRKIPLICEQLDVNVLRLPDYLKNSEDIQVVIAAVDRSQTMMEDIN